ncbi:MBOAT family protein [Treponema sp. C6A8]|uniref:MBOAT family O-acyltransferase n=1 Tax=Treponema sp. C6A8 TaxID=1410609 RepID=UPI0018CC7A4C|nr:MBOAT family protein [Treponema sp. C6A8]
MFFKYAPSNWLKGIIFPLGISFFTFQSISYIADCYTKKIEVEKNPFYVALFISFFPVISSGPIQRAGSLIPQLKTTHHFDYANATDGMKLFAWGLFKKLCIADRIAIYVNYVYGNASENYGTAIFLATILYSFQIYCDFSGYSDMAIGVAKYMGFDVGKNFDHPYLSQSVGEFWRRWHISLSTWLRDYIYIPLGGSRVALPRIYANLFITFLVSGLWHGSTWNFVIWGLLHGFYQCVGRAGKPFFEKRKLPSFIKIFITFCLVTFAWIFFRADNLQASGLIIIKITQVPLNLIDFISLKGELGLKEAIRILFALNENVGGFPSIIKIVIIIPFFLIISIATKHKDGLTIINERKCLIRWFYYSVFIFLIMLNIKISNGDFLYLQF